MTDAKISRAAKKPRLALIAWRFLIGVARVFAYGAKKYLPGNWYSATLDDGAGERYIGAAQRHMMEMQGLDGVFTPETLAALDDESGLPHIDHAITSLIMLRGIMVKCGALPADPGEGKEPPAAVPVDAFAPADSTLHTILDVMASGVPRGSSTDAELRERILVEKRVRDGAYDVLPADESPEGIAKGSRRFEHDVLLAIDQKHPGAEWIAYSRSMCPNHVAAAERLVERGVLVRRDEKDKWWSADFPQYRRRATGEVTP